MSKIDTEVRSVMPSPKQEAVPTDEEVVRARYPRTHRTPNGHVWRTDDPGSPEELLDMECGSLGEGWALARRFIEQNSHTPEPQPVEAAPLDDVKPASESVDADTCLNAMVRDFTEMGSRPKSEVRRRIVQYAASLRGASQKGDETLVAENTRLREALEKIIDYAPMRSTYANIATAALTKQAHGNGEKL